MNNSNCSCGGCPVCAGTAFKIGEVITVRASEFLGVPECLARVEGYTNQGYVVLEQAEASTPNFGPGDEFDVDWDRYILIGPPLNGKLVRVP